MLASFVNAGCPLRISLSTTTSWKFATWDQTVPNLEEAKLITGKGALRRVHGYEVHLLADAAIS